MHFFGVAVAHDIEHTKVSDNESYNLCEEKEQTFMSSLISSSLSLHEVRVMISVIV